MATATLVRPSAQLLTYEDYLTEGEVNLRYDIIEGIRVFMSSPTWIHQRVQKNILALLGIYEAGSNLGLALGAPFDIEIRRRPRLQTRQPDAFFISHAALASVGVPPPLPMSVAPELVVEIISTSETARIISGKLTDYCAIGVSEAWVVRPDVQTVEIVELTPNGPVSVATYSAGQNVQSLTFPGLTPAVADFFLP